MPFTINNWKEALYPLIEEYFNDQLDKNDAIISQLITIESADKYETTRESVGGLGDAHLEQAGLFEIAGGLIFGHYSMDEQPLVNGILSRIGERYGIPVVWNDDFTESVNAIVKRFGGTSGRRFSPFFSSALPQ
jgi:hypothetical protein